MPRIISVGTATPENAVHQEETMQLAKQLFSDSMKDIDRLLKVFKNGEIKKRHFVKPLDWYTEAHSFSEKNKVFIDSAVGLCLTAIRNCLANGKAKKEIAYDEIEAIILINTTGLSTPSLDAIIMNQLPFSPQTKRIPIWGLGCGGGASGLSRAYEYCLAYPKAKVLVVGVELCSLTFQLHDQSKSNFIGTSLFSDGAAAVLVGGEEVPYEELVDRPLPSIISTQSNLMQNSLDVMGWQFKDDGFYVVFSKDIPTLVKNWLQPVMLQFLEQNNLMESKIAHFIAHPGGKKVIMAYEKALNLPAEKTAQSLEILKEYGNMSSVTVFFVLQRFMNQRVPSGDHGIVAALGPGFSSELLLLRWV
ncbi:type III polyketide synthase [Lederbergia galactosidilytica]|uniref:Chalcone synthase n=1 Tax=Lederbergia galactosidilytica TaxID=217031 RepID=A0A177ZPB6_9BACI|nr:3-oxoacyl-[acyl-carrier-protein] synthase III C-terminal domain-containing protein [Lederbergia galactosidilytica]KRG12470.1 chalcone synthase [Virgibacillus soli]MBP1916667.1 alkylresorcinol/alkylpyrone synthase [Lederbergia galactosidilytica]OAK69817.1 chalcone synthase [Lederbergia galactosidilytica]